MNQASQGDQFHVSAPGEWLASKDLAARKVRFAGMDLSFSIWFSMISLSNGWGNFHAD
jgi:hypothetical protein